MMTLKPSFLILLVLSIATKTVLGFQTRTPLKTSFVPSYTSTTTTKQQQYSGSTSSLYAAPIDPAVVVNQAVGGIVNSPAILAVPIFGGVTVALVVVLFIVNSSSPTDPDV